MITLGALVGSRWARSAVGVAGAALALALPSSVTGGMAWNLALVIAYSGFGIAVEVVARQRLSEGLTVVVGVAVMLIGSTIAARIGVLTHPVQLGVVGVGLVLGTLRRQGPAARPPPRSAALIALGAGATLIALAVVRLDTVVADGVNHVLVIKRLWDTGSLGAVHHQLGVQLIGESYAALTTGSAAAGVFELGLCAALVLGLLVTQLAARDDRFALTAFAFAALPIALQPTLAQWSGVVLQLAAFWSLAPAITARRTAWQTIVAALGLVALRHEYVILGVPYIIAAVALPREPRVTRRRLAVAVAAWAALLILVEIALAVSPGIAIFDAVLLLAALPLTALVLRLTGSFGWRSPFAVMWFGTLTTTLALAIDALRPAQHSADAGAAIWLAAGLAMLGAIDEGIVSRDRVTPSLGAFGAAAAIAAMITATIIIPAYDGDEHGRVVGRFSGAVVALRDRLVLRMAAQADNDVGSLQALVPRGARLGFWGRSAAHLDFRRNPIRDVSWPSLAQRRRDVYFLSPLEPANLAGIDYVIVEGGRASSQTDPWGAPALPAIDAVAGQLELIERAGVCSVYRIKH